MAVLTALRPLLTACAKPWHLQARSPADLARSSNAGTDVRRARSACRLPASWGCGASCDAERYGRVIWDTCWTIDRVLNRGPGRFASCRSARLGRCRSDAVEKDTSEWRSWLTQSFDAIPLANCPTRFVRPTSGPSTSSTSPSRALRRQHARGRCGLDGQRVLVEQCGELLRRRSLAAPTTYRRNAARTAAAVELKYSGGSMKPHSLNGRPLVRARR
jgi:hypothetical protein